MRISVSSWATTTADVELSAAAILRCAGAAVEAAEAARAAEAAEERDPATPV
jgi:hypothetical protein